MFPHCVKIKARSSWKLKKAGKLIAAVHTGTLFSVPRNIMERGLGTDRLLPPKVGGGGGRGGGFGGVGVQF